MLKNDSILGPLILNKPDVVYRGAPSLRNMVVPNIIDLAKGNTIFPGIKRILLKCEICGVNQLKARRITTFSSNQTARTYESKSFITCNTKNVIYMLICPCGQQYVGRTIRKLQTRVKEHQIRFPKT